MMPHLPAALAASLFPCLFLTRFPILLTLLLPLLGPFDHAFCQHALHLLQIVETFEIHPGQDDRAGLRKFQLLDHPTMLENHTPIAVELAEPVSPFDDPECSYLAMPEAMRTFAPPPVQDWRMNPKGLEILSQLTEGLIACLNGRNRPSTFQGMTWMSGNLSSKSWGKVKSAFSRIGWGNG